MNKKIFISLILLLILLPNILATGFEIKDEYAQGETMIVKLSGAFEEPITREDILFYKDHVRIPFDFDFQKIHGDYYLSAQLLGKQPGNYSLLIEKVKYIKLGQSVEEDIRSNFSISENFVDFSVSPGMVLAEEDFSLKLKNIKDEELEIELTTDKIPQENEDYGGGLFGMLFGGGSNENLTVSRTIILAPGETKEINFNLIDFFNMSKAKITLNSENTNYKIDVYIKQEVVEKDKETRFKFEQNLLNFSMSTNSESQKIVYLENYGKGTLENITFLLSNSLEPYINLSKENINRLEDNSTFRLILNISSFNEEELIEGAITAKIYGGESTILNISFNILKDFIPQNETNDENSNIDYSLITCEEAKGEVCKSYEQCINNTEVFTKNNKCCLTECQEKEASSIGKIIGWVIILVIAGFVFWFIKTKYMKTSKKVNLLKIAKGKKK